MSYDKDKEWNNAGKYKKPILTKRQILEKDLEYLRRLEHEVDMLKIKIRRLEREIEGDKT